MFQAKIASVPDHMALPLPPEAASPDLRALFDTMIASFLTDKVSDDDEIDVSDWQAAKLAIMEHPARNGADIALKIITALHEIGPARENGALVLDTADFPTTLSLQMLLRAASEAASDPAAEWARRLTAFDSARAQEREHELKFGIHFDQPKDDFAAAYAAAPRSALDADEALADASHLAEDDLMQCPSPDASAFALKYLLAKGGGRETDRWDLLLEREAQRFSGRSGR